MADKAMISFRMANDMLKQVDARAEGLGISRSEWFTNMTRWVLANTYTIEQRGGRP